MAINLKQTHYAELPAPKPFTEIKTGHIPKGLRPEN
jgi:hypothetical protein